MEDRWINYKTVEATSYHDSRITADNAVFVRTEFRDCDIARVDYTSFHACVFYNCRFLNCRRIKSSFLTCHFFDTKFEDPIFSSYLTFPGCEFLRCDFHPKFKAILQIVPSEGEFIGWKKCKDGEIAKLRIPADAKRSNSTGRKCRANKAIVEAVYSHSGHMIQKAVSNYDWSFVYEVGKEVTEEDFNDDWTCECTSGIHFFITKEEAENYLL